MTDMDKKTRQADAPEMSIEITPAMIDAGVYEMKGRPRGEALEDTVWAVFLAMETARRFERRNTQ